MSAIKESRRGLWVALGSVVAAMVASACCWLPLLLISLGASAAGLSATFEKMRPAFLGVTATLLGVGFYLIYFRREKCAPGGSCETPRPKLRRLNQVVLWIATIMVAAFAFFPNYVGALSRRSQADTFNQAEGSIQTLSVEGMTCEACTVNVNRELSKVPGVIESTVDYEAGLAKIRFLPSDPPKGESLVHAIEQAGYTVPTNR